MAFTVQDIKTMAENFAETTLTITEIKAIDSMKLALSIIAHRTGYNFQVDAAEYAANTWNLDVLPENHLGVTEVNINDNYNTFYSGYRTRGRDILFYKSGSYIIHYKAMAEEPNSVADEIKVHPIYKDALWDFMLGYCRLSKWDGEDEVGQALVTSFNDVVASKWAIINLRGNHGQVVAIRHA